MTTTTFLAGSSSLASASSATIKEDGTIDESTRKSLLGASVATTATVLGTTAIKNKTIENIYEKYACRYVDSLSDKELAEALEKLELLEASNSQETTKII